MNDKINNTLVEIEIHGYFKNKIDELTANFIFNCGTDEFEKLQDIITTDKYSVTVKQLKLVEVDEIMKKEPTKPQPTRYRLEIPGKINKMEIMIAEKIISRDGLILEPEDFNPDSDVHISDIPESWLIPIIEDEQPVTADEYCISIEKGATELGAWTRSDVKAAFEQGEKNNELKHREKTSYYEWYKSYDYENKSCAAIAIDAWQACLKSRGFDG